MSLSRYFAAALVAAALAGCAGVGTRRDEPTPRDQPPPPAPVNLSGYNATFRQGYADGCASAGSSSPRRNEARYKSEMDYSMGWNDGYSVCGKKR
jgi:hypothetical protein